MNAAKAAVHDFWNAASCGEALYIDPSAADRYERQARIRYELEPCIPEFADFQNSGGKRVLEIGVGLGADHQQFAQSGANLFGIDLTEKAIEHTRSRLTSLGLQSQLSVGDAEALPFSDESFDLVYSWGVLHHSPDTAQAIREVHRVLVPGGTARVMIYHRWSMIGLMLWIRYALLRLAPWRTLQSVYAEHLESPGTKAYSISDARKLFAQFRDVRIQTILTHGDLLTSAAGQRHQGVLLNLARMIWPRGLIKLLTPWAGLFMLIDAKK
jgi:ubiquinone/menaquinone biosynthesis C-methylase UbiE